MFKRIPETIASAALLLLLTGPANAVNIAVNGSFETGDLTGWTQFPTGPGQQTVNASMPGNLSSDGSFHGNINNDVPFSNSLFKQANVGIGTVTPGMAFTITFDARGSYASPGGVAFAEVFSELDGEGTSKSEILGGGPLAIDPDPTVWTSFTFTGTLGPDVGGGMTLQLGATNGPGIPTIMFYDNVKIEVVPIPAVAFLFPAGLIAGLGWMRRKIS